MAQGPVISEFLAVNDGGLQDLDGRYHDWIEIFNSGPSAVSLEGWILTDDKDDLQRWTFPAVELAAGEFLVVLASGKDVRDPALGLHTSFRLSETGEFLGLIDPSGVPVSYYSPRYPEQAADTSYGLAMAFERRVLLAPGASGRYHVPLDDTLGTSWTDPRFDDSAWASGPTGIGFDAKDDRPIGTPRAAAARATATSPSGCTACTPVGETSTGIEHG